MCVILHHGGTNLKSCIFCTNFGTLNNFFSINATLSIFFTKFMSYIGPWEKKFEMAEFGRIGHICARPDFRPEIFWNFFFQFFPKMSLIFIENIKKWFFAFFKAEKHLKNDFENFGGPQKFLHDFGQICIRAKKKFLEVKFWIFKKS